MRRQENHVPVRLSGNTISRSVWGKPCSRKAFWEHDFAECLEGASQGFPGGLFGAGWAYGITRRASREPLDRLREPHGADGPSRLCAWVVAQRPLECSLGARSTPLGGFWAAVSTPLGEPFWDLSGSFWGLLGASLEPLGSLLGPSWGPLGASWGPLGAEYIFSPPLRPLLGPSRAPLVPGRLSGNMISRGVWGKPCSRKAFWEHDFAECLGRGSWGFPGGPFGVG